MAADDPPVPQLTEVERTFGKWEACFNQHKQELRAVKSPQQQYQEKKDGIQTQINEWWTTYETIPHAEKQMGSKTEREKVEQLYMQKSSLAAQHELTKKAQQATYEQEQKAVFNRLCVAIKELTTLGLSTEEPDTQARNQTEEDESRHDYSVQNAGSGAEDIFRESTENIRENPEDNDSEEQERASDPGNSPDHDEGGSDSTNKRALFNALSPSRKRPRQSGEPEVSNEGRRTMTFQEVYQNSLTGDTETIVQYPRGSDLWYVIHCAEHNLRFGGSRPLLYAARHLGGLEHNKFSRQYQDVIKYMGIRILGCDKEKAKMNNTIAKNGDKIPVRAIQTRSGGIRGGRGQRIQGMRVYGRQSSRRSMLRHLNMSSEHPSRTRGQSSTTAKEVGQRKGQPQEDEGHPNLGRGWRRDGSFFRFRPDTSVHQNNEAVSASVPDNQEHLGLTPGDVCLTYFGDNAMKTPVIILPFDNMASIGIEDNLKSLNLTAGRPKCCIFNRRAKRYQWAPGYEDGGKLVTKREYPVLCLLSSTLQKCPASWVEAAQLTAIDIDGDDTEWKLNDYNRQATEILRQLSKQKTFLMENSDNQDQDGNQGTDSLQEQTVSQSERRPSRHNSPPPLEATTSRQMKASSRPLAPTSNRENNARGPGQIARAPSIETISSSTSDSGSQPQNEDPRTKDGSESYLETLARNGLTQVPGDLDTVEGVNSEVNDAAPPTNGHPRAPHQPRNSTSVSGPRSGFPEETERRQSQTNVGSAHQATLQGMRFSVDVEASSQPLSQVNAHTFANHDPSMQAKMGEMFNGIERHLAENQKPAYWSSQPAHANQQTHLQNSGPQGPMNGTQTPNYTQMSSPLEANPHPPSYINTDRITFEQPTYPSPMSQTMPASYVPHLPGIQTVSGQPQSRTNHVALPPIIDSGGPQTWSPNNAIDSPTTRHQDTTQSEQIQNSTHDSSTIQNSGSLGVWPHFAPGRLRDDLEHWARHYNCRPEIESLRRDSNSFFCPFCPPDSANTFKQAYDIIDHLQKVHPIGFWANPPATTPPASQRGSF